MPVVSAARLELIQAPDGLRLKEIHAPGFPFLTEIGLDITLSSFKKNIPAATPWADSMEETMETGTDIDLLGQITHQGQTGYRFTRLRKTAENRVTEYHFKIERRVFNELADQALSGDREGLTVHGTDTPLLIYRRD